MAVAQVSRKNQIISTFFEGALSNVQVTGFVLAATFSESLGDIGWHRDCGSARLRRQTVCFCLRENCSEFVDFEWEAVRLLPDLQILKALGR